MIGISRAPSLRHHGRETTDRLQALVDLCDGNSAHDLDREERFPSANVLCDLADALRELARGERRRAAVRVRLYDEPCEIGIERAGDALYLSLYSGGAQPVVHLFERRVAGADLARRLVRELDRRRAGVAPREAERIVSAMNGLQACVFTPEPTAFDVEAVPVESLEELPFSLSGELLLRHSSSAPAASSASILRTDLLGLLARGRIRVTAFEHTRELSDVHLYLVAEQLARFAVDALEAYAAGRPIWRKTQVGGAVLGVRLLTRAEGDPRLALTLGPAPSSGRLESWTFPALEVGAFARAVIDLGRSLARTIVRRDRSQTHNLRLVEFRANLREIAEMCREMSRADVVINESPESYRAYAREAAPREGSSAASGRVRFEPKWTAAVPSIDLRATFQCGDAFVVGSTREMSCIDRKTGTIAWTRPVAKGVSVLTPCGIARFDTEGNLTLLDIASGETKNTMRLLPRVGAPVTGAVVSSPGLPRMLVISEGKRHLVGVDLEAGEVLWRYAARRAGTFRLRRAGRLVIVSSGEQALTAIDVVGGNVVWRYCDRLRFAHVATVADDSLFALAGDGAFVSRGGTRLCHLDPWSGSARWSVSLREGARPIAAPLVARNNVLVATLGGRGTRLTAFDKKSGEVVFERDACVGAAAPLIVDDVAVLNSESGELIAIDASDGSIRYRHVFAEGFDGDRPRRLEPVLRSGALFVPQSAVHVLRPSDGTLLGSVATDLVPDLVRVDERCDVYVAEESGHIQAFSGAARTQPTHLRLVRS
ncbi:MAG: PQQ-binding-like beta-propeller repeat protein [Polyangiaceae bacterium]|nr:PQQ-binding-like beta-propeller repeat protein [Polyangiaceae bacterium]